MIYTGWETTNQYRNIGLFSILWVLCLPTNTMRKTHSSMVSTIKIRQETNGKATQEDSITQPELNDYI